jgi:glycosyltransferase involved in cell wall biosynthesis
VAVVIPAYNAAATLNATLHSARAQSYDRLEIIVVDDGSTDATASIVHVHCREDNRVRLFSQENCGVAAARNRGISEATADFVATLDADDLWHPEKVVRQMTTMYRRGSDCGLVYAFSVNIDGSDRVIASPSDTDSEPFEGFVLPALLKGNFIANGSSPLMRKSAVQKAGGYDTRLRQQGAEGCEDLKLYLALAEAGEFAAVPMALIGYRMSSTSMSSNITRMIRSHRLVTEPYRARYPDEVRLGRVYLALYYAERELSARNYSLFLRTVGAAMQTDAGATLRRVARRLLMRSTPRLGGPGAAPW